MDDVIEAALQQVYGKGRFQTVARRLLEELHPADTDCYVFTETHGSDRAWRLVTRARSRHLDGGASFDEAMYPLPGAGGVKVPGIGLKPLLVQARMKGVSEATLAEILKPHVGRWPVAK